MSPVSNDATTAATTSNAKVSDTYSLNDSNGLDDEVGRSTHRERYRGTSEDERDMKVLGKRQELKRNFKISSMIGFASVAMASWESLPFLFTYVLVDGGLPVLFWGFLFIACGMVLVYLSLAEMVSMSPTAGGQYHWVSELAPRRFQKSLSYITGWLTFIGWQAYLTGAAFMTGTAVQGLIALCNEDYSFQPWQGLLLTLSVVVLAAIFNTGLCEGLTTLEGGLVILHVLALFVLTVPLWITAPRGRAKEVFFYWTNNGGWPTTGLASMIGLTSQIGIFIGYDCSFHMAEEMKDASRRLPQAIMISCAMNFTFVFGVGVTLMFTAGDIDSILTTSTRQPFIQLIYNATQNRAGTAVMVGPIIILLVGCVINEVATSSRQTWALARDGAIPLSHVLDRVHPSWNVPLNAIILSVVTTSLLACISLGSSVALNAISSLGGVSVLSSYIITISCVIYRRYTGPEIPPRRWSLGRYGAAVNIGALCFLIPIWIFVWWPLMTPVTLTNMNWASAMFGGLMVVAVLYYMLQARHGRYKGPVTQVNRE